MDTINKVLQTKTERHTIRPYIYEARMHALYGNSEETINCNCQSSSICGLIEYLKKRRLNQRKFTYTGFIRTRSWNWIKNIVREKMEIGQQRRISIQSWRHVLRKY